MTVFAQDVTETGAVSDGPNAVGINTIKMTSRRVNRIALNIYTIDWVAGTGGAVANTIALSDGWIQQVAFTPAAAPATPPSAQYTATLLNTDSVDVLVSLGNGATGLPATGTKIGCPLLHNTMETLGASPHPKVYINGGDYTPTIASAGNGGGGRIVVYISDVMG